MSPIPCDRCHTPVKSEHLSQADEDGAPWLCLVCVYPEFYEYSEAKAPATENADR